ncbi:Hypothetical protein A7982_03116 [Minicystis rosea]|nr:Hypothetical protein A7982_03116 [Minicystis rosea]
MHPLLVAFPLGMLGASVLFDAAALALVEPIFADVARYDQGIGLVAAVIASLIAVVDLAVTPRSAEMGRIAMERAIAQGAALLLFGAALSLRTSAHAPLPSPGLLVLGALGVVPAAIAGTLATRLAARA